MKSTQEHIKLATSDNILNKIKSFKKSEKNFESKLHLLEDAIISGKVAPKNIKLYNLYQDLLLIFWEIEFHIWRVNLKDAVKEYHIYSTECLGHSFNFWFSKGGANLREVLI